MKKCSANCIPCCDFCVHCLHAYATDGGGRCEPLGCMLHRDYEHQSIVEACGECDDFQCFRVPPSNADRIRSMDREHQIEAIAEALCNWAGVGGKEGSYIYDLTRCKSAFGVGTMSFDDFQEWEEDRCFEAAAEFVDWLQQPAETEGTE